ncbi:16S rRNA (uracil(1498)-N(3))-methyltransferase [uncultured Megamonas sp.]|uniref:16S rRNA (uracil(1498)-N(3))-methyltransferase n=1 Tax=uncultured Megamonas sp. TaxID=286140 RepID=UPI0025999DFB|nr:16S rRNA (uracil(1498)-N(3))-methyltransferase [uncultured Megamonas sp.]
MRRLFIDECLSEDITIKGDDAKHLLYAMRVRPEQVFTIVDRESKVAQAKVISCTSDTVQLKLLQYIEDADTEAPIEVVVAQCLPKGDKMEFIVQKAVELGASSVVPVVSRHCVVKYDDKKKLARQQKWQKIADEAVKQCGRTIKPTVEAIVSLEQLAKDYADYTRFICYEAEDKQSFKEMLQSADSKKYLILIGPEGGFAPEEVQLCKDAGFKSISMGKRILRAETASIAALTIVMYEKGDLGGIY